MKKTIKSSLYLLSALFATVTSLQAQAETPAEAAERQAYERIFAQGVEGPSKIQLGSQASFELPANMIYLPKRAANEFMDMMGNGKYPNRLGLVLSTEENTDWLADISFENSGYISDEDAKDWDVDGLYESLEEGNKEQNKERRAKNIAELELVGWVEKPHYDEQNHRLVWSIEGQEKGQAANEANTINYNTYVLGREGYIELNFITDKESIKTNKQIAHDLLARVSFNQGKTYQDFNPSMDKKAEYGLAALIGGAVVAKKLGLFAVIGAFILKFWKIAAVVLVAFGGGLTRLFKGKKKKDSNLVE